MSIKDCTAVSVRPCNVSEYHQMDVFVRIEQVEDGTIPRRDASWSHVTSLHASLHTYGFHDRRPKLSVTFHLGVSAMNMTTSLTCRIKAGR